MEWVAIPWTGEFHGLYSPWGRKESDTTVTFTFTISRHGATCFSCIINSHSHSEGQDYYYSCFTGVETEAQTG